MVLRTHTPQHSDRFSSAARLPERQHDRVLRTHHGCTAVCMRPRRVVCDVCATTFMPRSEVRAFLTCQGAGVLHDEWQTAQCERAEGQDGGGPGDGGRLSSSPPSLSRPAFSQGGWSHVARTQRRRVRGGLGRDGQGQAGQGACFVLAHECTAAPRGKAVRKQLVFRMLHRPSHIPRSPGQSLRRRHARACKKTRDRP